ncbi:MAG: type II toxin-antitoxin system VapC family toxin [Chloroflexi bacterium]|nr:type II toxin-antitoxin system VapC family toxin [Chloroflexota bacterium]
MSADTLADEARPSAVVVDASVWVSRLVLQDIHHQASRDWLEAFTACGGRVVAPALLLPEIAGAISRRTGAPELARQAVQQLQRLRTLRLIALDRHLGQAASLLAADLGLRGSDATYVALADQLKIPLLTWDNEQVEKAGIRVAVRTPEVH